MLINPNFWRRLFLRKQEPRHRWNAYRLQGGGGLTSPGDMNEAEASQWVASVIKGEIMYIDRECGFIFYRPKE